MTRQTQGFTLMELMIVVGVIAILAMAAYPAYTGYIQKGYDSEAIQEISTLEVVLAQYRIDEGTYVSAATTDVIKTNYGWVPASKPSHFDYKVTANSGCPTGQSICYTVTATGKTNTPVDGRTIVKTSWGSLSIDGNEVKKG